MEHKKVLWEEFTAKEVKKQQITHEPQKRARLGGGVNVAVYLCRERSINIDVRSRLCGFVNSAKVREVSCGSFNERLKRCLCVVACLQASS